MNKNILNIFSFIFISFFIMSQSSYAQTSEYKCQNFSLYGLTKEEVNLSNSNLYCWEIKYLKDYHNRLSINLDSYYLLFPKHLSLKNIDILRENGITPEKADYLYKYFIDNEDISDYKKIVKKSIANAKNEIKNRVPYIYGRPLWYMNGINSSIYENIKGRSIYKKLFKVLGKECINNFNTKAFNNFPLALEPVGIIGRYLINAFGEIMGKIKEVNVDGKVLNQLYLLDSSLHIATWNSDECDIEDISHEIKRNFSCITCTMFEISFNTVSKIGFVLYDKLARYVLDLMTILFLIWTLWIFFEKGFKNQDGFDFMKMFFSKSVWVFIISAFLSVSIIDENNIINYTVRPLTDFMVGYNKMMTKAIDKNDTPWVCKYSTKDIQDNKVLFSSEVKKNIVCTIERIVDFNNLNIMIGKQQLSLGWRQILNFEFVQGFIKLFLGFTIMALFFMFNLTASFFFIESLFKIAIVVFLFPLILMGYAFDKGKSFIQKALDTFLFAIFQLISLSIMCSIISLLMLYISSLDSYGLQNAIINNNGQEMTSQILLALSFNTNRLLEIVYTAIICWYLMGQALSIANTKFTGFASNEKLPNTFVKWTQNIITTSTKVFGEKIHMKRDADMLAFKLNKDIKKEEDKNNKEKGEKNV